MDFCHYPSETMNQVDGPPHFEDLRKLQPCNSLPDGKDCCSRVWELQDQMLPKNTDVTKASADYVHKATAEEGH